LENKNPPRISAVVNERSSHSLQNQPNRSFSFDLSFFSVVVVVLFLDLTVYFCFVLLTSSSCLDGPNCFDVQLQQQQQQPAYYTKPKVQYYNF